MPQSVLWIEALLQQLFPQTSHSAERWRHTGIAITEMRKRLVPSSAAATLIVLWVGSSLFCSRPGFAAAGDLLRIIELPDPARRLALRR
jgi:hypothetical protein